MELIRINESKLKVMLSPDDMARYAISCETIDYENTETRRAFWDILDIAKHQTGFDAARDKVYIQVYPSRSGGCEMYVTRLDRRTGEESDVQSALPRTRHSIYRFASITTLLTVCRLLQLQGYTGESSAYRDAKGNVCYLRIRDAYLSPEGRAVSVYPFLSEYGSRTQGEVRHAYIQEQGICICAERAVETLASLA